MMNRKFVKLLVVTGLFMICSSSFWVKNYEEAPRSIIKSPEGLQASWTRDMCQGDASYTHEWARNGDSISYDFSTFPSAIMQGWAMTKNQFEDFKSSWEPVGVLLAESTSGSGTFSPSHEADWYIVFIKLDSGCTTFTYTIDFSPIIKITHPTSSTQILTESDLQILWDSHGISGGITIDLYKGSSYIATLEGSTSNDGIQYCQIPDTCIDGTNYRIKLTAPSSSETDFSSYFTIIQRKLVVSRPLASYVFVPHATGRIEWHGVGTSSTVNIDLYANSTFLLPIANETQDDDEFFWTVWLGSSYASDSHYQIRIEDAQNHKYFDFRNNFTILSERFLTVLNPLNNSSFNAGSTISVQWENDTPCDDVIIELIRNNNTIKQELVDNIFSYTMKIPSRVEGAKDYQIRITAADNSTLAYSDFFTIIPKLRISGYNITMVISSFFLVSLCFMVRKLKNRFFL